MGMKAKNETQKAARQRLRDRVFTILSSTNSGKDLTQSSLEKIADSVMKLFGDRVKAVGNEKATVWAAGAEKILHDLRSRR
jgi:hypothetical protein